MFLLRSLCILLLSAASTGLAQAPPPPAPNPAPTTPVVSGSALVEKAKLLQNSLPTVSPAQTAQVIDENTWEQCRERLRQDGVFTGADLATYNEKLCQANAQEAAIQFSQNQALERLTYELEVCSVDSIAGKKTGECQSNPDSPACAGAAFALESIKEAEPDPNCNSNDPAIPCPFIAGGETAEAWLDAAEKHLQAMDLCIRSQFSPENASDGQSLRGKIARLAMVEGGWHEQINGLVAQELRGTYAPQPANPSAPVYTGVSGSIPAGPSQSADKSGASRVAQSTPATTTTAKQAPAERGSRPKFKELFDTSGRFIGNDGSQHFGFSDGEVFERFRGGEKLRDILHSSKYAEALPATELIGKLGQKPRTGKNTDEKIARSAEKNSLEKSEDMAATTSAPSILPLQNGSVVITAAANPHHPESLPIPNRSPSANTAPNSYSELSVFERVHRRYQASGKDMLSFEGFLLPQKSQNNGRHLNAPMDLE